MQQHNDSSLPPRPPDLDAERRCALLDPSYVSREGLCRSARVPGSTGRVPYSRGLHNSQYYFGGSLLILTIVTIIYYSRPQNPILIMKAPTLQYKYQVVSLLSRCVYFFHE